MKEKRNVIICVDGLNESRDTLICEIPQLGPDRSAARIPVSALPSNIAEIVNSDTFPIWLFAVMESDGEGSTFSDIEIAPEPDPNDGLA